TIRSCRRAIGLPIATEKKPTIFGMQLTNKHIYLSDRAGRPTRPRCGIAPGAADRAGRPRTSPGRRSDRRGSYIDLFTSEWSRLPIGAGGVVRRDPVAVGALVPDQLAGDPDGVLVILLGRPGTRDDRTEPDPVLGPGMAQADGILSQGVIG